MNEKYVGHAQCSQGEIALNGQYSFLIWQVLKKWFGQMVDALAFVHSKSMIHR